MFMVGDAWRQLWRHGWKEEAFSRGMRSALALASVMAWGWWLDQEQLVIPLLLGVISVLWAAALPMLPVRQNLAHLYDLLGEYLHLKSRLFEPVRGIDLERRRLALALHNGRVVEALNATKESLFSRMGPGSLPVWLREAMHPYFAAQDVHERVSSSHEHYEVLAKAFFHSDVLYRCQRVLALLGQDCLTLAQAIRQRQPWVRDGATARAMEDLDAAVEHLETGAGCAADERAHRPLRALHALAANLGALDRQVSGALDSAPQALPTDTSLLDRQPRTARQAWQRVRAQLNLASPLMRHAVRLSLALAAGYALMLYTGDRQGFWILLTIVFVCQPQYGATLTRLVQRIWGTVLGLLVGWALLRLFPEVLLQSVFTVVAGVLFFATRQTRYTLATAAITSLVLLSFNQVGDGFVLIVPRLLDTLAGSLIAGLAVWLVLPSWQARQLHRVAAQGRSTTATLDHDATLQESHKREACPHYQGGRGYQPTAIYWVEQDLVVVDEYRDGNVGAGMETLPLIQRAFASLPPTVTTYAFRADTACYDERTLKWLADPERPGGPRGPIGFTVGADLSEDLRAVCAAVPEARWGLFEDRPDETVHCTEVEFTPGDWPKRAQPLRYVALRIRKKQGQLFASGADTKYLALVSNRWELAPAALLRWHWQKAGTIELVHDITKNELGAAVPPCGRFGANAAWYRLSLLTYNVLSALKSLALPPALSAARPKRLRFAVFTLAGRIVSHAGRVWLRMSAAAEHLAGLIAARQQLALIAQALPAG